MKEDIIGLSVYMLPSITAYNKKHKDLMAIFVLNALAGWSFVGWVIAMVWAHKK